MRPSRFWAALRVSVSWERWRARVLAPEGVGELVAVEASGLGQVAGVAGIGLVLAQGAGGGLQTLGQKGVEEVNRVACGGEFPRPELVVVSGGFKEDRGVGREQFEEFVQVGGRGGEGAAGEHGPLGREQAGAGGA
jgi:hypothetical protein